MVDLCAVRQSNAALRANPSGFVAVFVGATSGIGAGTLKELVKDLSAPKFYVIGRSKTRFSSQLAELKALNSGAVIIFMQAEISLLKNVDAVCEEVASKEAKVDLLFMSAGLLAFGGPHYTAEGIDTCASISYYSRMRLTANLLPLLKKSQAPRILSVLAGGNERQILTHDLGLERNYTIINVVNHTTTMHTLAFEHLAKSNPSVSFIHAYPGWVRTDILGNLFTPKPGAWYGSIFALFRWMAAWGLKVFGISAEESGERQAFHATSSRYPSKIMIEARVVDAEKVEASEFTKCSVPGNGVYRLSWDGEGVSDDKVLGPYRKGGLPEKIWDHTIELFDRALSRGKSV